jgi:small-conductance mechanosensitive channel
MIRHIGTLGLKFTPFFIAALLVLTPTHSWGHDATQAAVNPSPEVASVVVSGRKLFNVLGLSAYPAKRRARAIAQHIEDLARDENFNTTSLRIEETTNHHQIAIGDSGQFVLNISEGDARYEGTDRESMALTIQGSIVEGIEGYRNDRDPETLRKNAFSALIRTVVLGLVLLGTWWGFRRIHRWVERRFKRQIEALEKHSLKIIRTEQVWRIVRIALTVIQAVVVLSLVYVFMAFVMDLFPWTRRISDVLLGWVTGPLIAMGSGIIAFIPSLIFLVLLFYVTRWALRALQSFFKAVERGRVRFKRFDPEWAMPTYRIVSILVILFAVVVAYPYIPGSGSDAFQGLSILAGVLLSLGAASAVSNAIAGYTMIYRRAFKLGDRVKIGDTIGDVIDRQASVTHLLTPKNEEVVVPNSMILSSKMTNFSSKARENKLILHTKVGIGYEVPWRQVKAMLLLAAERTEGLLKDPKPFVFQKALADFAVDYELNVYCGNAQKMATLYDALHGNIQDVFNEYGVQIMTPSYEADTPDAKIVPKEDWYAEPARPPQSTDPVTDGSYEKSSDEFREKRD